MGEGEEGALAFAAEFVAIGAVAGAHEGGAPDFALVFSLAAVGEAEGVSEFVGDAADEDGVVFTEGDAAVLAIADDGFFQGEVAGVELGGIELPGGASGMIAAGVVGGFVGEEEFFFIPVGEVAEEDDGFLIGVDAGFAEGGEAFFFDLVAGLDGVVVGGFLTFDEVDDEFAFVVVGEVDAAVAEAEAVHFPGVESTDVFHDTGEARVVVLGGGAVGGIPIDEVEGSGLFFGVLLVPGIEDLEGGGGFCFFFAGEIGVDRGDEKEGGEEVGEDVFHGGEYWSGRRVFQVVFLDVNDANGTKRGSCRSEVTGDGFCWVEWGAREEGWWLMSGGLNRRFSSRGR